MVKVTIVGGVFHGRDDSSALHEREKVLAMTRRFAFIHKPVSGRAGWGSGMPENDLVLEQQSRPKWRTFKKKKIMVHH